MTQEEMELAIKDLQDRVAALEGAKGLSDMVKTMDITTPTIEPIIPYIWKT